MATVAVVFSISLVLIATASAAYDCKFCLSSSKYFSTEKPVPVEDLIKDAGYTVETHEIKTEDGYLLTYHRIPRGKNPNAPIGRPVLVQHGILGSSASWVMSENGLGFTLADAGFDVWLANSRGNYYSRKHVKYNPDNDKKKFWDFSWHEVGVYDMPASIDYILQETEEKDLLCVAYSMGTTAYFVMETVRPEYNNKIQAAVVLAPIVYPWNIPDKLFKFMRGITDAFSIVVKAGGLYEVLPYTDLATWTDQHICTKPTLEFICADIIEGFGFYQTGISRVDLDKVLEYNPAGASYKQFHHFQQISVKGSPFQEFDYGYFRNLFRYQSFYPPKYDLSKVTSPTYVYYATNDWRAVPEDVFHLVKELPTVKKVTKVEDDQFNHLDFMWAKDAKELVYDDVVITFQAI